MRYRLKLATWTVVRDAGEPSPRSLRTSQEVGHFARDLFRTCDDDKEHFFAIFLNARLRYLMHTEVSVGTQANSLVHPREIFGPALREGAFAVIVIHNHPSGDHEPSDEGLAITRRLVSAGDLIGVPLLDHLIFGNGTESWTSVADAGMLKGQKP